MPASRSRSSHRAACVAWDPRPIFGGKVLIQAKRYKNTVGASAVRDLFGTLQNEGASKGILVTTSGYGQASFDFAQNKPIELIELIDGANLLYLLAEHPDAGPFTQTDRPLPVQDRQELAEAIEELRTASASPSCSISSALARHHDPRFVGSDHCLSAVT